MKRRKTLNKNIFIFSIAALALACVGFSSWFIGQSITERELSFGITIENSTIKAVVTDASITTKSITLDDTNTSYSLGFSSSVTVDDAVKSFDYKLSLVTKKSGQVTNANNITLSPNQSAFRNNDVSKQYSYFTFTGLGETNKDQVTYSKTISTTTSGVDSNTYPGFYFYNITELNNLGLGYGSYFDFKNPEVFYQSKLDEIKDKYMLGQVTRDYYLDALSDAETELNNFKSNFADVQFVLKLETININY